MHYAKGGGIKFFLTQKKKTRKPEKKQKKRKTQKHAGIFPNPHHKQHLFTIA
jgi:hypothetical protein